MNYPSLRAGGPGLELVSADGEVLLQGAAERRVLENAFRYVTFGRYGVAPVNAPSIEVRGDLLVLLGFDGSDLMVSDPVDNAQVAIRKIEDAVRYVNWGAHPSEGSGEEPEEPVEPLAVGNYLYWDNDDNFDSDNPQAPNDAIVRETPYGQDVFFFFASWDGDSWSGLTEASNWNIGGSEPMGSVQNDGLGDYYYQPSGNSDEIDAQYVISHVDPDSENTLNLLIVDSPF